MCWSTAARAVRTASCAADHGRTRGGLSFEVKCALDAKLFPRQMRKTPEDPIGSPRSTRSGLPTGPKVTARVFDVKEPPPEAPLESPYTFSPQLSPRAYKLAETFNEMHGGKARWEVLAEKAQRSETPQHQCARPEGFEQCTFSPEIGKKSQELDGKTRWEALWAGNPEKERKREERIRERDEQELAECTFTPQILQKSRELVDKGNSRKLSPASSRRSRASAASSSAATAHGV